MFTLINSENLKVEFDPVQTENHYNPSVAFDIFVCWKTTFQTSKIEIKEHWLENSELNQFQKHFQDLVERKKDIVELGYRNLTPILKFIRINEGIIFELQIDGQFPVGEILLKAEIEEDEILVISERMKNWAKWW